MAMIEEVLAMLGQAPQGQLGAPGAEDEMRRGRRGPARGGYEGLGGPQVTMNALRSRIGGMPEWAFSGAMGRDFRPGGGGLASLMAQTEGGMAGNRFQGPAFRNFANQGFDFMPPGQDQREAPGGPNIAPGNIDNAQALNQPFSFTPGVPQGVARGRVPGQVAPRPQTQGWRNVAPGYSAAAQFGYGTPEFGANIGLTPPGSRGGGPPGATADIGIRPGGGGGGGPAGGGPRGGGPVSQNPIGGGPGPVAPAAGGGGGGQGTVGGTGGGGGRGPGAGGQQVGGRAQEVAARTTRQAGEDIGAQAAPPSRPGQAGGRRGGGRTTVSDAVGGTLGQVGDIIGDVFGGGSGGGGGSNRGRGDAKNRSRAVRQGQRNKPGRYAGETNAERKTRLAAKEQRQEAKAARTARRVTRSSEQAAASRTPEARAAQAAGQVAREPTFTPAPAPTTTGSTRPRRPKNPNSTIGGVAR